MNSTRMTLGLALSAIFVLPAAGRAQREITVEVHGGGGVTIVDVQEASGQTSEVLGEDTGMYQFFGRVFFADLGLLAWASKSDTSTSITTMLPSSVPCPATQTPCDTPLCFASRQAAN